MEGDSLQVFRWSASFRSISSSEIVMEFKRVIPELQKISEGKVSSSIHRQWHEGNCKTRQQLTLRSHCINCISSETAYVLMQELANVFCTDGMKMFSYSMTVLLPETVRILVQNRFDVNEDQAKKIMFANIPIPPPSSSDDEAGLLEESPGASLEGAGDLISRGKALQKKKKGGSNYVPVSMPDDNGFIDEEKKVSYCKDGTPVEFAIDRFATYEDVVNKASEVLSLPPVSGERCLFTFGGALINHVPGWNLAQYMKQLHRGTLKIGIGDLEESITKTGVGNSKTTGIMSGAEALEKAKPCTSSGYSTATGVVHSTHAPPDEHVPQEGHDPQDEPLVVSSGEDSSDDFLNKRPKRPKKCPPNHGLVRASRQPSVKPVANQCMEFFAKELSEATRGYCRSSVLGKGGFGVVYKGTLRYSAVAIKVLTAEGKAAFMEGSQFQAEVSAMNRFRHQNILQLFGYCAKPPALVFELMANGSLYQKLHKDRSIALTWEKRRSIIADTCRGMVYLHTATPPTIHQDIKSANILLDENYRAKLGDFGFSIELPRISSSGKTMFTSQYIARSEGYYPSEVAMGRYSDRSDVYSFGVVVLEIWTGQRAFDTIRRDPKLVEYFQEELKNEEEFEKIFDSLLPRPTSFEEVASRYFSVVTKCLKKHSARPPAVEVLQSVG